MSIEVSKRRAVFSELKEYCHHSKDNDFIEVCEWANGEGYDINISRSNSQCTFSLTPGEFELLQVLMHYRGE